MSTLSSMCDNLRLMARLVRDYDYDVISNELRKAADTIWYLHCKCSDLTSEREELSSRLEHATEMNSMLIGMPEHDRMQIATMLTTIDGINLQSRIRKLEDENARLRSCLSDNAENARQIMGENDELRKAIDFQALELGCMTDNRDILYLENEKLRRLARGLNWCTENAKVPSAECEHCPLGDTFFECGELSCEKLMRELGVTDD